MRQVRLRISKYEDNFVCYGFISFQLQILAHMSKTKNCFVNVIFIIVITQFQVTILTHPQVLTCCINANYVVGHKQESKVLFQCMMSIL
jgi:hypothetical protein